MGSTTCKGWTLIKRSILRRLTRETWRVCDCEKASFEILKIYSRRYKKPLFGRLLKLGWSAFVCLEWHNSYAVSKRVQGSQSIKPVKVVNRRRDFGPFFTVSPLYEPSVLRRDGSSSPVVPPVLDLYMMNDIYINMYICIYVYDYTYIYVYQRQYRYKLCYLLNMRNVLVHSMVLSNSDKRPFDSVLCKKESWLERE